MVDSRFQDGTDLVKGGAVFLEVGESGRTSWSKGDLYRGGSSMFFLYQIIWTDGAARAG